MATTPDPGRKIYPARADPIRIVPLYHAGDAGQPTVDVAAAAPAAPPQLTYRNGPLLTAVEVFTIFWGTPWQQAQHPLVAQINQFFDFILTSPLITQLAEYSVPGKQIGSTDAATVNQVSYYLARIRHLRNLPQKVLIVHQFTEGMVANREQIRDRPGVAIVHNLDGFGTPDVKTNVYNQLSYRPGAGDALRRPPGGGRYNGFKLFYKEDTNLMAPAQALGLRPAPDVVVYE